MSSEIALQIFPSPFVHFPHLAIAIAIVRLFDICCQSNFHHDSYQQIAIVVWAIFGSQLKIYFADAFEILKY